MDYIYIYIYILTMIIVVIATPLSAVLAPCHASETGRWWFLAGEHIARDIICSNIC